MRFIMMPSVRTAMGFGKRFQVAFVPAYSSIDTRLAQATCCWLVLSLQASRAEDLQRGCNPAACPLVWEPLVA